MILEQAYKEAGIDLSRQPLPVHAFFSETARRNPLRLAILHDQGSLTYQALAEAADRVAAHLETRRIGPGTLVGLCSESSPAAIAAMLGILKVGAAYVPFDPSYPENAINFIRQDSAPGVVLLSRVQSERAQAKTLWAGQTLLVEDLVEQPAPHGFSGDAVVAADELAYVMYTSGSTGRPKGVMVPHRAITRLVLDTDYASFGTDEVFLQQAPLAFDASTFEIWGALLNGGTLALPSGGRASLDDIARSIERFGVTTLWLTAGLFHLMVEHRLEALRPLRQLLAGGDVLSPSHVRKLREAIPSCRLINGYGPTENTTFSCCYTVPDDLDAMGDKVPIGTAINGTSAHVLDEDGGTVADGEIGELYVGGLGLARGYLNMPELTAQKFVANPFDDRIESRLYRTGDRVRRRPDGALDFLGRADRQIKISGKRVELDEIEATARRSGLVGDAATLAVDAPDGSRKIVLFATPGNQPGSDAASLRRFIAGELPDYMMPARIELLADLPLSPTGKLDRSKLAAAAPERAPVAPPPPATGIPQTVYEIWRGALATDAFGLDDNFFDLGGTSLQLVGIHAALQKALERPISLIDLFSHPTVRSLARWLEPASASTKLSAVPSQQDMAAKRNASLARARQARGVNLP